MGHLVFAQVIFADVAAGLEAWEASWTTQRTIRK